MNEIVKYQPRNVTIIIKVEVPSSYHSLTETQRLGAIILCQTDHCINGIGIEEALLYLKELSGSEVTKDNYSEVKKELKDKIADNFRNLGGNA